MRIILDGRRVVAVGGAGLAAGDGQAVAEAALTLADFAAADEAGRATGRPYDVTYDGAAFGVRARAAGAAEAAAGARAADLATLRATAAGWATATAAQKDAATLAALRLLLDGAGARP